MTTRIRESGYIFTKTKARKQFDCAVCPVPIRPGEEYLKVDKGGGGVGWSAHPDRIHNSQQDIKLYIKKWGF